jgi:hypothetical protein
MVERTNIGLMIETELNEQLNKAAPRGMKAEAIRALIQLLLDTQKEWIESGRMEFVVDKLLRKQCKLIVIDEEGLIL